MSTLAFELNLPPIAVGILVALFVIISFMLLLVILIQRPQGGGLSEAFGSNSGSGHTAFGAKTGDALTTATIGIFVFFILVSIVLNYAVRPPKATNAAQATTETTTGTTPPASGTSETPSPSLKVETPVLPGSSQETAIPIQIPAGGGQVTIPAPAGTQPATPPASNPTPAPAPEKPAETPTPAPAPSGGGEQPKPQ